MRRLDEDLLPADALAEFEAAERGTLEWVEHDGTWHLWGSGCGPAVARRPVTTDRLPERASLCARCRQIAVERLERAA